MHIAVQNARGMEHRGSSMFERKAGTSGRDGHGKC